MQQEIFINLPLAKKSVQKISIYLSVLLIVLLGGFFITDVKDRILLIFIFSLVLLGFLGLWVYYFRQINRYQIQPYLVLDETGVKIFSQNSSEYIRWLDVKDIDKKRINGEFPKSYYFIETDKIIRLDNNMTADMIVTLKQYAEKYGTARFIY